MSSGGGLSRTVVDGAGIIVRFAMGAGVTGRTDARMRIVAANDAVAAVLARRVAGIVFGRKLARRSDPHLGARAAGGTFLDITLAAVVTHDAIAW